MKTNHLFIIVPIAALLLIPSIYVLPQVMPKTPIKNGGTHGYYKDSFGVYIYQGRSGGFIGESGPDLRIFKYRRISKADPETFQILQLGDSTGTVLARDKNHVFYRGEYVPTGDVNSLELFNEYAKDKNNVYFRGMILTGLDTATFENLGNGFIKDRNGLYLPNSSPPRKIDLVDAETLKLRSEVKFENDRMIAAEDKNFIYYSNGGSYLVKPKPNVTNFQKLGCGYYLFERKVYYTVYQLAEADPETFRVLETPRGEGFDVERCDQFYAADKNYRWQFGIPVRPQDEHRNREIKILLASPEDKRKMSKYVHRFACRPEPASRFDSFGYTNGDKNASQPGTIRTTQYMDAGILDAELLNAEGKWQILPSISDRMGVHDCSGIFLNKFSKYDEKPWFARRDQSAVSFTVNRSGNNSLLVIADANYSVKLALLHESLALTLKHTLADSRLEYRGSGNAFENKFFLNKESAPEIWIMMQIKDAPAGQTEGKNFVVAGFVYRDNSLQCIDSAQCSTFGIPNWFPLQN